MSKLQVYNGKEWIEIAKNGKDAVVDYDYILSQIPKPVDGKDGADGFIDEATISYLENEIKRVEDSIPTIVKQKETNFGKVIRDIQTGTGIKVDRSDPNRPILTANSWITYCGGIITSEQLVAGGEVLTYLYEGATIFRHITTAEDANGYPVEDAFYTDFDGITLSGLIIARG